MRTPSPEAQTELLAAADLVAEAVRSHALACSSMPSHPASVVAAGEALVSAVRAYEELIADRTGWSNPLRHLGPRVRTDNEVEPPPDDSVGHHRVQIDLSLKVDVLDPAGLANLVEGRGAVRPPTAVEGVRSLVESDGWDPGQYPSGILRLTEMRVEAQST